MRREAWRGLVAVEDDVASRTRLPLCLSTILLQREWVVGEVFGAEAPVARVWGLGEGASSLPDYLEWTVALPCSEALLLLTC